MEERFDYFQPGLNKKGVRGKLKHARAERKAKQRRGQGCCHAWVCRLCTAHGPWAEGVSGDLFSNLHTGAARASRGLGGGHFRQSAQHKRRR